MIKKIPVSIYFMQEWWSKHYHVIHPRPEVVSDDNLEQMSVGRKQFLFEHLGQFGIGEENPKMDGSVAHMVMSWQYELVSFLLGIKFEPIEAGGFNSTRYLNDEEIKELRPIDLAKHPEGAWILKERDRKIKRYGRADYFFDLGSVINHGFYIRGQDIYIDLLINPGLKQHLFEAIIETERMAYRFFREAFPPSQTSNESVPISNCNVVMIAPETYEKEIFPFDTQQCLFLHELTGTAPKVSLHHCDVKVDSFIESYAKLPGISSLQASFESDVAMIKKRLPEISFSAMISPAAMASDLGLLKKALVKVILDGANNFAIWNIDPVLTPGKVAQLLETVSSACAQAGCQAAMGANHMCWEEREWAFPQYKSQASWGSKPWSL